MRLLTNGNQRRRLVAAEREATTFTQAAIERHVADKDRYRAVVEHLYDLHNHPKANEWSLKLGNIAGSATWSCTECGRPWPCLEWQTIRTMYGFDRTVFQPLTLVAKPTPPDPTLMEED